MIVQRFVLKKEAEVAERMSVHSTMMVNNDCCLYPKKFKLSKKSEKNLLKFFFSGHKHVQR